jgi:hypothetical protein
MSSGFETEIRIQRPANEIKKFPYCHVALVTGGDADRVQERYLHHPVFREKGGGPLAVGDNGVRSIACIA